MKIAKRKSQNKPFFKKESFTKETITFSLSTGILF